MNISAVPSQFPMRLSARTPRDPPASKARPSVCRLDVPLMVRDSHGRYRPATIEHVLAAARNAIDQKFRRGGLFDSPATVKTYLCAKLGGLEHEIFAVLFLDHRHRLIEYIEMFRGTIDGASVHPREVVKEALRHNSGVVILAHNHPSGTTEPSQADRLITQRLREALQLVDIRVIDHVIVGGNQTASLAELGLL